jgi:cytochrome c2
MNKNAVKKYILQFLFIGIILFFIFDGYLVGLHKLPSYSFFRKIELNLFGNIFEQVVQVEDPKHYDSTFLRLYSNQVDISDYINRIGKGGGMTSFDNAILLLTHDGQIFEIYSADSINTTKIQVPDYGLSAYKRAAQSEDFKHLTHAFEFFRYNDILFFDSKKHRGLAISYTEFDSTNNCYRNAVAVLPIDPTINSAGQLSVSANDWNIIYRSQPCLPFKPVNYALDGGVAGGRMEFRPPSTILMGNGDYLWDGIYTPENMAKRSNSEYGRIMSIDLNSQERQVIASGLRNPQGIVLDKNGTLWTVEHGLRGGDELNRIVEGGNYGWPKESLGTLYSKLPFPNATDQSYGHHKNYRKPTFAWVPSVAISNLTLINGFHNSWDDDLLMGSLKSKSLYHIRIDNNRVLFSEKIEIGERIRYAQQHNDERLVLWTDSKKLIFLTGQPFTNNYITDYLEEAITNEALRKKVKVAFDACRKCHSIEPGDHTIGPSLASVYGAEIGGSNYKHYSRSLKEKDGYWTQKNLHIFLDNPEQFAPDTEMPKPGIDDATLEEIIKLLEALGKNFPG